jgi:hypothetical protein
MNLAYNINQIHLFSNESKKKKIVYNSDRREYQTFKLLKSHTLDCLFFKRWLYLIYITF